MTAAIGAIPLDQAQPGMVLGEDVTSGGNMLLPRGTAISAAQLESLRRREVSEIVVLLGGERSAAEIQEARETARKRVAQLFRRAGTEATMQDLLRTVLDYRLDKPG